MTSGKKKFVISIYAPLGGQGASFLASQLVHQLAQSGPSCLLDLNLDYSMSLYYLNQEPSEAFRKSALGSGESALLSSFAITVENNYFAVGAPLLGYGQFAVETDESVKDLFELCQAEFDYTVIDLPRPLHVELTRSVLSMSDLILAISENTEHSASACVKLKKILADQKMGVDAKKLSFLFNRTLSQHATMLPVFGLLVVASVLALVYFCRPDLVTNPIFIGACVLTTVGSLWPKTRDSTKSALSILANNQIKIFHDLPHDDKSCRAVINQGKFLDDKTRIGKSLIELAEKIKKVLNM